MNHFIKRLRDWLGRDDQSVLAEQAENLEPNGDPDVEWIDDETNYANQAYGMMCAYETIDGIDPGLMSGADAKRMRQMKRKCLRIAQYSIDKLYENTFGEEKSEPSEL